MHILLEKPLYKDPFRVNHINGMPKAEALYVGVLAVGRLTITNQISYTLLYLLVHTQIAVKSYG